MPKVWLWKHCVRKLMYNKFSDICLSTHPVPLLLTLPPQLHLLLLSLQLLAMVATLTRVATLARVATSYTPILVYKLTLTPITLLGPSMELPPSSGALKSLLMLRTGQTNASGTILMDLTEVYSCRDHLQCRFFNDLRKLGRRHGRLCVPGCYEHVDGRRM